VAPLARRPVQGQAQDGRCFVSASLLRRRLQPRNRLNLGLERSRRGRRPGASSTVDGADADQRPPGIYAIGEHRRKIFSRWGPTPAYGPRPDGREGDSAGHPTHPARLRRHPRAPTPKARRFAAIGKDRGAGARRGAGREVNVGKVPLRPKNGKGPGARRELDGQVKIVATPRDRRDREIPQDLRAVQHASGPGRDRRRMIADVRAGPQPEGTPDRGGRPTPSNTPPDPSPEVIAEEPGPARSVEGPDDHMFVK